MEKTKQKENNSIKYLCKSLSISVATGNNWLKAGKIIPTNFINNKPTFSNKYIENLKIQIISGQNNSLKSRRNKKYVTGSFLYHDYISENSKNFSTVSKILDLISENSELSANLELILAEASIQLFVQKFNLKCSQKNNLLKLFIDKQLDLGEFSIFINDLIDKKSDILKFISQNSQLFNLEYTYENNEDILGFLYISCRNIGHRKVTGAYYTPNNIVKILISELFKNNSNYKNKKLIDPSCGTGNFLLQLPNNYPVENIYASDIDEISIKITRINLFLKYNCGTKILQNNIKKADYLESKIDKKYDYIIGNPPWGCDYNEEEKEKFRKLFQSATGSNIESYDLFLEHSLNKLNHNGIVSFVLPESVLTVKTHKNIRDLIIKNNSINYINYLGNAFDKVQCPSIILQILHNQKPINTDKMRVIYKNYNFLINTKRDVNPEFFNFAMTDVEYNILNKINNTKNCTYLKDNSTFALGIVTGNNEKYITHKKSHNNEIILKGSDISKFKIKPSDNYINFVPENFQQVAPTELYRAPEKLLYRFICNQLVFAYDNDKHLTLNSCNILIPEIKNMDIKYILAILNSRIAQFIYEKQFNSLKVLRSHIEQIPIPKITQNEQSEIVKIVEKIIKNDKNNSKLYDDLDKKISTFYNLTKEEYSTIIKSLNFSNTFFN